MNKKIFRSSFFIAMVVLLSSLAMIFTVLFSFFEKQLLDELQAQAKYISHGVENEGLDFFDDFDTGDRRITIVQFDGKVIYDTSADVKSLDNHIDREEIAEAITDGSGTSIRYSYTLTEKTIYYATRLEDGNVLRISTTQYNVFSILLGLVQPIASVILVAFVLSIILSYRVSEAIIRPINDLDLENPENNNAYEELSPLLRKISVQKITIARQIREAGKKQEEFHLITENMSEGFLIIDKDTTLLTYNSAALRLLDIDNVTEGSILALNRTKSFRQAVTESLAGSRAEKVMKHNDRSYNIIANPVYEDEEIIGAVILIIDVTERLKGEALRREFTANVSHELKTPLTSISGFAELMKSGGTSEETVMDFSKSIYDEAQRLITLVNDIIKISELDEKNIRYKEEEVDLYDLSSEIIQQLKINAVKKNVAVSLKGSHETVLGVKKILNEMLYNLCDNAIKYNKENGSVDVTISRKDNNVSVTVRDTGIGIPPADRERVFERFYRVDKSHSKTIGGTGLGLAIVKHGAIYHKAKITLESAEQKGTSITVTFDKSLEKGEICE